MVAKRAEAAASLAAKDYKVLLEEEKLKEKIQNRTGQDLEFKGVSYSEYMQRKTQGQPEPGYEPMNRRQQESLSPNPWSEIPQIRITCRHMPLLLFSVSWHQHTHHYIQM